MSSENELNILRKVENTSRQLDLASDLGISVGKINYILKALVKKGLIKVEHFSTAKSKKQYKYLLTPKGIKEKIFLTEKFIVKKKHEYEELQTELQKLKSNS